VNEESLQRANAFLAAVTARTVVGAVMEVTPAEIGREIGLPDPLSAARAVRALIARRRLEPAQGSYRLVDGRPVDPHEKETIERPPRRPRRGPAPRANGSGEAGRPSYSAIGQEVVEKLIDLGREVATLRANMRAAREEARTSREARIEAEQRADHLSTRVRDLEARAEMAESNLRALLATAKGAGREARVSSIADSEMEAILGVLKGDETVADSGGGEQRVAATETAD
jgi:outer membrane murein-binding lipoprotein Lpp